MVRERHTAYRSEMGIPEGSSEGLRDATAKPSGTPDRAQTRSSFCTVISWSRSVSSQARTVASERESLDFQLEYGWRPFTMCGKHLSFREHCISRLYQADCNHWGAAVYKWEGLVKEGDHAGQTGVLIGETGDLRSRVKQYVSGTQESGNKFWRDQFLTK